MDRTIATKELYNIFNCHAVSKTYKTSTTFFAHYMYHCIDSEYYSGCLELLPVNEWFPVNKRTIS